jgi:hypothetical protein
LIDPATFVDDLNDNQLVPPPKKKTKTKTKTTQFLHNLTHRPKKKVEVERQGRVPERVQDDECNVRGSGEEGRDVPKVREGDGDQWAADRHVPEPGEVHPHIVFGKLEFFFIRSFIQFCSKQNKKKRRYRAPSAGGRGCTRRWIARL